MEGWRKKARGSTEQGWVKWGLTPAEGMVLQDEAESTLHNSVGPLESPLGNETSSEVPEFLLCDACHTAQTLQSRE